MKHLLLLLLISPLFALSQAPTAAQIRAKMAADNKALNIAPEAIFKTEDKTIWTGTDSIKIRLYYPDANKNKRIIYNVHGGALIAGDLESHENVSRTLANKCNAIVVAIDYRKPPEAPFPQGIEDVEKILQWITTNAASFGGNKKDIVLVGDSGGGLFITALQLKLQRSFTPAAMVLVNPAVDLRNPGNPFYKLVVNWYLNGKDATDSLVSPITATNVSFFSPTLIITSEEDELKEQGVTFLQKLQAANVKTHWIDLPKTGHLGASWAANHPEAKKAVDATVQFINSIARKE